MDADAYINMILPSSSDLKSPVAPKMRRANFGDSLARKAKRRKLFGSTVILKVTARDSWKSRKVNHDTESIRTGL